MNNKKFIIFVILYMLNMISVFASGRVEDTQFVRNPGVKYMSPAVVDGNFDVFQEDFSNDILFQKKRTLHNWSFEVYNFQNVLVYHRTTEINKENKTTTIPPFVYDGKDNNNIILPDGQYTYILKTTDNKGNKSSSPPYTLIVDNSAPQINDVNFEGSNVIVPNTEHTVSFLIDGKSDINSPTTWQLVAEKDGKEIIIFSEDKTDITPPQKKWQWSGNNPLDETNSILNDGTYNISVVAFDRAGNTTKFTLDTSVIISTEGIVFLEQPTPSAFSPNDDGIQDEVLLTLGGDKNAIGSFVSSEIIIYKENDKRLLVEVARKMITEDFPKAFPVFKGRNTNGSLLPDGNYKLSLKLATNNNAVYITNKIDITIDTIAPQASFFLTTAPISVPAQEAGPLFFGGSETKEIIASFNTSEKVQANIEVYKNVEKIYTQNVPSNEQRSVTGEQSIEDTLAAVDNTFVLNISNDTLDDGKLSDGLYRVMPVGTDDAGNPLDVLAINIFLDTEEKNIKIQTDKEILSARKQELKITLRDFSFTGLKKLLINVNNESGATVNTLESAVLLDETAPEFFWNARNNAGEFVADGMYVIEIDAMYYNGENVQGKKENIRVDSTIPGIETFAPQGDVINPQSKDENISNFTVLQNSSETDAVWTFEIRDIFNAVIYSAEQTQLDDFTWNGKNTAGKIMSDGDYFYLLTGTDQAGNSVRKTYSFIIDTGVYDEGRILTPESQLPEIYFPGYSEDIFSIDGESLLYENLLNIRAVARMLKAYPKQIVTIVGHAAPLLLGTNAAAREQTQTLIPLSRQRAGEVRNALMILGVSETRMSIEAVGGLQPVVSDETSEDFWKNRRVEFSVKE